MLTTELIIERALPILLHHGVKRAGLFGSFVHGEANDRSDIDMLVELRSGSSLIELASLQLDLQERFSRKVDLVEYAGLKPMLRASILNDEVRFHG